MTGDGVADPTTTLAAHGGYEHVTADLFRCECGLEFLWQANFPDTIFAAHQLAVLAEEGWAIERDHVVTTVAELDALPVGSVVQTRHKRHPAIPDVWQRWDGDGDITDWCAVGHMAPELDPDHLPATVLWTPTAEDAS